MYERFQQRLQKEGLADAEGNPTEKTLEIRRQIVERKAEREKAGGETEEDCEESEKQQKHWVRTAKAAGVVLVVGACVFGASMTSEANRIRLVETISGVRNSGDVTWTDNGENRDDSESNFEQAKTEIVEKNSYCSTRILLYSGRYGVQGFFYSTGSTNGSN